MIEINNKNYEISGWVQCKFGDIIKLKNGYAFKSSEYTQIGVPIIRISNIKDGLIDITETVRVLESNDYEEYLINKGDILIAMSGATTGKFGFYYSDTKAYQNQRVGNIQPLSTSFINKGFVYYLLYSLKRNIEKEAYGGAQPNIAGATIEELFINLPPFPEQRAIVSKIEQLFSELDNGIASLKKAQEQLKVYRQAVLKWAFEGKLTEKWREENRDKLVTGEELIAKINEDRQIWYDKEIIRYKDGKTGVKPKILSKIETLSDDLLSTLPKLPKNWLWVKLGDLAASIKDGPHYSPQYVESGIPFISGGNIRPDGIDFKNVKYTQKNFMKN